MLQQLRTFLDIQDAIIDRAKLEDTDEVRRQLKEKINTKYTEIVYEEYYSWSGDTRPLFLPQKYVTGTITVTNGSDQITGSSTVWTEFNHRFLKMSIPGSNTPFKILNIFSNTTLTMEQAWIGDTAAGSSYYIYKDEFGLWPDCQDVRRLWINGIPMYRRPLPVGPTEMNEMQARHPFAGGVPKYYTVWGLSHYRSKTWANFNINTDFWEDSLDSKPRNKNLVIWPGVRTQDKYATVRYTKIAYPMNEDADEPMIPVENRVVLVYGVLLEHFLQNRDIQIKREWEAEYKRYKTKMAADIETYDDALQLVPDNRSYRWHSGYTLLDEDCDTIDR